MMTEQSSDDSELSGTVRLTAFITHHSSFIIRCSFSLPSGCFCCWPDAVRCSAIPAVSGTSWPARGCSPPGTSSATDPFSFTRGGQPWVADQWLAECGMAAVHAAAGWDGLLLLTAAVLAAIYAWIAARLMQGGLHWLPTGLLVALILLVGSPQFHVRPLVLSIGLLGVTFAWLVDVEAGRKRLGNCGGSCRLWSSGQTCTAACWPASEPWACASAGWCATSVLGKVSKGTEEERRHESRVAHFTLSFFLRPPSRVIELAALLMTLAAATLINPYGLGLPRDWLQTLAMPLPKLIEEHAPLSITVPTFWIRCRSAGPRCCWPWAIWPCW